MNSDHSIHLALLWSDWLILGLAVFLLIIMIWMSRRSHFRVRWRHVLESRLGMVGIVILLPYIFVGLLDSVHFEVSLPHHGTRLLSVVDLLLLPRLENQEITYSAPFSLYAFNRSLILQPHGEFKMGYARLQFAGQNVKNNRERNRDVIHRIGRGLMIGILSYSVVLGILLLCRWVIKNIFIKTATMGNSKVAWRLGFFILFLIWLLIAVISQLVFAYHIFGTGKVGNDIFYETVKSIRTGFLIGTLTTLFTLPFALVLGTMAGYFRGVTDDIIQYLYTTLSSIPGVLLISAMVLVLEVYINRHADLFPTLEQRADIRLLALCLILGITSWSSLCRLLRAETLKVGQLEFVQAATAFGMSHMKIIAKHIIPNVMHIVIITVVLDFSGLVLAEAVLSYIGVGVDPVMISWGNMINSSRLELAREPTVWWPLLAALTFMFIFVLAANLFADAIRDAFDPRMSPN